jgi:hypothetical protein
MKPIKSQICYMERAVNSTNTKPCWLYRKPYKARTTSGANLLALPKLAALGCILMYYISMYHMIHRPGNSWQCTASAYACTEQGHVQRPAEHVAHLPKFPATTTMEAAVILITTVDVKPMMPS